MKTTGKVAKTAEKLEKAKQAVEDAKRENRAAFRAAVAALFAEYDLCLEADGKHGAHLTIKELGGSGFEIGGLPE